MVELSLKTTDEDDMRNTERTIEHWCTFLHLMKSVYTVFTMFSSFLLIVFIILDIAFKDSSTFSVNVALVSFGGAALIGALLNLYFLKRFTFTGDGVKD